MKGLEVLLSDRSADILDRGMTSIKKSLHRMVQKGTMPDEAAREAIGRVKTVVELEVCFFVGGAFAAAAARGASVAGVQQQRVPPAHPKHTQPHTHTTNTTNSRCATSTLSSRR